MSKNSSEKKPEFNVRTVSASQDDKIRDVLTKGLDAIQAKSRAKIEKGAHELDESAFEFEATKFFEPMPYDLEFFAHLFEASDKLRPNVDAYAHNIDGFGHRFEATVDPSAENYEDVVTAAIRIERISEIEDGPDDGDPGSSIHPNAEDVKRRIQQIQIESPIELARAESWFMNACVESSFPALRRITRSDLEITGNAYWEILREETTDGSLGKPVQVRHCPPYNIRLRKLEDSDAQTVPVQVRQSPMTFDTKFQTKVFRRFAYRKGTKTIWFKAFGDPRTVSKQTGKVYKDEKSLPSGEKPATELMHFKIHSSRSCYGIPRWIGAVVDLIGSRQASEVNQSYFQNSSIPPLAIFVNGGQLSSESVTRLQSYFKDRLKGVKNYHDVLIVEALAATDSSTLDSTTQQTAEIKIQPLTEAQQNEGTFLDYDERNSDKAGAQFRMPRLLRGDIRDFNRATAEAALDFAESQVFAPEREEFDWWVNREILPQIGVKLWTFASNGPDTSNRSEMAEVVKTLTDAGALTPGEARFISERILNFDLQTIEDEWTRVPLPLQIKGIRSDDNIEPETPDKAPSSNSDENEETTEDDEENEVEKRLREVTDALYVLRKALSEYERRSGSRDQEIAQLLYSHVDRDVLEKSIFGDDEEGDDDAV